MKYSIEKRIFLNNEFTKKNNITLVQRAFRTKFKSQTAPDRKTIKNIVNNYNKTGSVDRKQVVGKKRNVRTDELVKSIKNFYLDDPKLSLRKTANLVPASVYTIRNVLREDLNYKPYKIRRTFKLYSSDHKKRLKFVDFINSKRINVTTSFICSDEAYFYLHGGHNIQNNRIWAEFQPKESHEVPLNDEKVMV